MFSPNYEKEIVHYDGVCCPNTLSFDHFCGNGSRIADTFSTCNICGKRCPAEVFKSNDTPARVYMVKHCPEHGRTSSRISSDANHYYVNSSGGACDCATGCGVTIGENAKTASQLHTCTLVVEIVYDCNMSCTTCYADSPHTTDGKSKEFLDFEEFKRQVLSVYEKQGRIDVIQLSGGEPTLHPQFFEIVKWCCGQDWIGDVLLNTNGLKLIDPIFIRELCKSVEIGKFSVYLQYDSTSDVAQHELRAGNFLNVKERVISVCRENSIPVALVMTVSHDNKFECGNVLERVLKDDNIRWVVYQPEFICGRNDQDKRKEIPVNLADIIHSAANSGVLDLKSWMPLPCSDPNCGSVSFLVRVADKWLPVSSMVDMKQYLPLIENRVNFDTGDQLLNCGCDNVSLANELAKYGIDEKDIKMVFIKPFMDVRTYDERRIQSCCTHVLTPDGKVDSFCRYYANK